MPKTDKGSSLMELKFHWEEIHHEQINRIMSNIISAMNKIKLIRVW